MGWIELAYGDNPLIQFVQIAQFLYPLETSHDLCPEFSWFGGSKKVKIIVDTSGAVYIKLSTILCSCYT